MRNFTSGLYFRDEKYEDLIPCPVKNKHVGHAWGHEFVKKKISSRKSNVLSQEKVLGVKREGMVNI